MTPLQLPARRVGKLWSPTKKCSPTWRLRAKSGQVVSFGAMTDEQRQLAESQLLRYPPDELFNCALNRFTAIISDEAQELWALLGEGVVRECCRPKLALAEAIVPGSVAHRDVGKTTWNHREIDLSKWRWHLVLDERKLVEWHELYGISKGF